VFYKFYETKIIINNAESKSLIKITLCISEIPFLLKFMLHSKINPRKIHFSKPSQSITPKPLSKSLPPLKQTDEISDKNEEIRTDNRQFHRPLKDSNPVILVQNQTRKNLQSKVKRSPDLRSALKNENLRNGFLGINEPIINQPKKDIKKTIEEYFDLEFEPKIFGSSNLLDKYEFATEFERKKKKSLNMGLKPVSQMSSKLSKMLGKEFAMCIF